MIRFSRPCFLAALAVLSLNAAHADIMLTVDSAAKTYDISGSITGTPGNFIGPVYYFNFRTVGSGTTITSESLDLLPYTDSTPNAMTNASLTVLDNEGLDSIAASFYYNGASTEQSITASGFNISYASLAPELQTILENFAAANTTLSLVAGATADTFTVTAVPEPSTYAALIGLAAGGLILWRRRR